jgi:hypothetical protein
MNVASSAHRSSRIAYLELTNALRVHDHLDAGDLPRRDREAEHGARLAARSPRGAYGAIDERGLRLARVQAAKARLALVAGLIQSSCAMLWA